MGYALTSKRSCLSRRSPEGEAGWLDGKFEIRNSKFEIEPFGSIFLGFFPDVVITHHAH